MRKDFFLVFVRGKPGQEADYAAWFCGPHRQDMQRMPEVSAAHMFTMVVLEGQIEPAQLCAIYETADGLALLDAIAKAKGAGRLPQSDLQGPMNWRLFTCTSGSGGSLPGDTPVLLILFPDGASDAIVHAGSSLAEATPPGTSYWAMAKLSPAQSRKGREYSHALFMALDRSADAQSSADRLRARPGTSGAIAIALTPLRG